MPLKNVYLKSEIHLCICGCLQVVQQACPGFELVDLNAFLLKLEVQCVQVGLHDIGNGHYAYLQPSGSWGYSNAGLVVDGEASLLVDTLFDQTLTAEMLRANCRTAPFVMQ